MDKKSSVRKCIVRHEKGLHARVAAMIVQKTYELQKKYHVAFYIQKSITEKIPLNSLLILTALKIKAGDEISLSVSGDFPEAAAEEMAAFIESDFSITDGDAINKVDTLLQDNVVTAEQIFCSMANGLIVIDENDIITLFNPVAEKIFNLPAKDIIGRKISDALPVTSLDEVNRLRKPELGARQDVGGSVIVKDSTPIIVDNECKGAVCIFEDISKYERISWDLKEIRELKEKYYMILESVQEGICVLDQSGTITYVNPAYLKILKQEQNQLTGKKIGDISPEGSRSKVIQSGEKILGRISKKENGVTVIANVYPIVVDGEQMGVISVINDITEMQNLMEKLNNVSAKAEYLEQELIRTKKHGQAFDKIIGNSGKLNDTIAMAAKAAESIYTVLIRGESGTGKELMAEGIHFSSPRAKGPFIRVNCAAIPAGLLESELFGHEKGAFTGAVRTKLGKFELANKGTIFLDEIGEMEKNMQVKLLRIIQKKEFQRVGGEETINVDVRIIAATNQNLEALVKMGDFREDLYYRLNVIPILLPPLRERKEDIPPLVEAFMKRISGELGKDIKGIRNGGMEALMRYNWPGNIRELENVMERTITLLDGKYIEMGNLPHYIRDEVITNDIKPKGSVFSEDGIILAWEDYEKIIIRMALKRFGSFNAAGKALGLTHKTISTKARKYGLEKVVGWENVSSEKKGINSELSE